MSPAWGNSWRLSSCAFLPASVRTRDQRHQNREQTVPAAPTSADELASGTRQRAFAFIGQAGLLWWHGTALRVENHWFLGTWAFQHRTQLGLGRRCFVLCALSLTPPNKKKGNKKAGQNWAPLPALASKKTKAAQARADCARRCCRGCGHGDS